MNRIENKYEYEYEIKKKEKEVKRRIRYHKRKIIENILYNFKEEPLLTLYYYFIKRHFYFYKLSWYDPKGHKIQVYGECNEHDYFWTLKETFQKLEEVARKYNCVLIMRQCPDNRASYANIQRKYEKKGK